MALDVMNPAVNPAEAQSEEQIAPEIPPVIAAAAAAMLGERVRIGSIELQQDPAAQVSKWTRQGRATNQASHNLRSRR